MRSIFLVMIIEPIFNVYTLGMFEAGRTQSRAIWRIYICHAFVLGSR